MSCEGCARRRAAIARAVKEATNMVFKLMRERAELPKPKKEDKP